MNNYSFIVHRWEGSKRQDYYQSSIMAVQCDTPGYHWCYHSLLYGTCALFSLYEYQVSKCQVSCYS